MEHLNETTQTFKPVSKNELTIYTAAPFAALSGTLWPWLHLYAGLRRDQLCFGNQDLLTVANSFQTCPGMTSPKVDLTFGPQRAGAVPQLGLSFAKAFHADDPRIGGGSGRGQLLASAREYQLFAAESFGSVQARMTLSQVRTSAEFAKIDPDTGLQEDVGPGQNRFLTLALNQRTAEQFWRVSWSEADARDREDGTPLPEAPRMIVDALFERSRLPFGLAAKTEFEYVKAKPLGDGFTGRPLRELRFALTKSFGEGRWTVSGDGQYITGYSGQTLEILAVAPSATVAERPVGVPVASYATLNLRYQFNR